MSYIKKYVIILAGGVGSRYGAVLSKQFHKINGCPIIVKTLCKFLKLFPPQSLRLVINPDHQLEWSQIKSEYPFIADIPIVYGGAQRYYSVKNALETIDSKEHDLIGVHDGVRPFVSYETISNTFQTAERLGNAVPYFDAVNTIRIEKGIVNEALNRAEIKIVQNPQVFRSDIIKDAYKLPYSPVFLDDATIVEKAGYKIQLCHGNYENIKITHPQDIYIGQGLENFLIDLEATSNGYLYSNA
ncbi:IspD/TarI family cytidylyltransferase [Sphingobacterium faecium]|uniref:IspD/TarI family cytidylyltransferase n=1 Tax=Sphingobacterium faecium TaxID=34087 RepID=UPI003DA1CFD0